MRYTTSCKHASSGARPNSAVCTAKYAGKSVYISTCANCEQHTEGEEGRAKLAKILPTIDGKPIAPIFTEAQLATIETRRAICGPCEKNKGLSLYSVRCDGCGCAGLSLLSGMCQDEKWSA